MTDLLTIWGVPLFGLDHSSTDLVHSLENWPKVGITGVFICSSHDHVLSN